PPCSPSCAATPPSASPASSNSFPPTRKRSSMTRPTEVKPREDDQPGTKWEEFEVGAELPQFSFSLSPYILAKYALASDSDPQVTVIDGKRAAMPPNLSV